MSFLIIYLTKSELIKRLFKCRTEILEKLSNCGASRGQSSEEMNILWPFGEGSTISNQICCEYHCSTGNGWKGKCGKETKRNLYIFQPFDPKHFDNLNWTAWQKEKSCKLLSAWRKIANTGKAGFFCLFVWEMSLTLVVWLPFLILLLFIFPDVPNIFHIWVIICLFVLIHSFVV